MSQEWEARANKDKDRYADEMKVFKASGGGDETADSGMKRKKEAKKSVPSTMTGEGFKSKEYVSDDGSTDESEPDEKKAKSPSSAGPKKPAADKKHSDDDDEDEDDAEESDASAVYESD